MSRISRRAIAVLALLLPALLLAAAPQAQARVRSGAIAVAASSVQFTTVGSAGEPLPVCTGYGCTTAQASVTITGFSSLGGIPECDELECPTPGALTRGSGEVRLTLRCAGGEIRRVTKDVTFAPSRFSFASTLNVVTRVDADTASLSLGATLVDDSDRALCGSLDAETLPDITLVSATLRRVRLAFDGAGTWPSLDIRLRDSWAL